MEREAFCRWYDKPLRDVAEHEQEACAYGCVECGFLTASGCTEQEADE